MSQPVIPTLPASATVGERIARLMDMEAIERAGLPTTVEPEPTQPNEVARSVVTEDDAERITRLIEAGLSDYTHAAYRSAWGSYTTWLTTQGYNHEDAFAPVVVTAYLTSLHEQGTSPSTVEVHRAAIIHHAGSQAGALRSHEGLRAALRGIRREGRRQWTKTQARALSADEVRAMTSACPQNLRGMRDRALLLTGLALGVRASNLGMLLVSDLTPVEGGYDVLIRFSKTTDQPVTLALPRLPIGHEALCPVRALETYSAVLESLGQWKADLPVFRAVRRGGNTLHESTGPLSVSAISEVLRSMAERAGVSSEGLSSHSLRATFATLALASGMSESAVMDGRWSSLSVFRGYDRSTRWQQDRIAGSYLARL